MLENSELKEAAYAEHLTAAKEALNNAIIGIIPAILSEFDRVRQLMHVIENFDDLSIAVTRNSLTGESVPSLKLGLDENEKKGERGFILQFSTDEARNIQTEMDPSLYAALCEEGILRVIRIYESFTDELTDAYSRDIEALYKLLEFVQTASNPFEISERIKMYPFRY